MSSDLVLFLAFALAYTAAWWLVMRGTSPVVHVHVQEEERDPPRKRARTGAKPAALREAEQRTQLVDSARTIPIAKPAPMAIKTTAGAIPSAWNLPEPATAPPDPAPAPAANAFLAPAPEPKPVPPAPPTQAAASRALATDDPIKAAVESAPAAAMPAARSIEIPKAAKPTSSPALEFERATTAPTEPMTSPNDAMNSNPLDFPNWMEETMNSRSKSEPTRDTEPSAPIPAAMATPAAKTPSDAGSPSPSRSSNTPGTAGDALRGLSRVEKERMQIMAQLDNWGRAWAEVEKRSAQCVDDLTRQVETLAQEHAQCDSHRREVEQRSKEAAAQSAAEIQSLRAKVNECEPFVKQAKDLGARCSELGAELTTARGALDEQRRAWGALEDRFKSTSGELEKAKDHLSRSQEATKEATARELDWQRRYHEDTGKLMQQLTSKSQECERWIGENQKQKGEIDRQTRELRAKDEIIQTMSMRCSDLEQRSTTLQVTIQDKEARIIDLARQISDLQKDVDTHKAAEEEQAGMLQAAQGVLSELQPKLLQLEKRLTKH